MKKLIIALIAIAGLFNTDTAQAAEGISYKQAIMTRGTGETDLIVVPAGKVYRQVDFLRKSGTSVFDCWFKVQIGGTEFDLYKNTTPTVILGPATIKAATASECDFILVYELVPNLPE